MKATLPHRIDKLGRITCSGCEGHLSFRVGFLSLERKAEIVIYQRCKHCRILNMVFLDRLEPVNVG